MHYLIIGNGVAGVTAALTLRKRERAAAITVISSESKYFFSRTALMYAFMGQMELKDLEPYERAVWSKQNLKLVQGRVIGLDAAGKTVQLADGQTIAYDKLLLATGSVGRKPGWKGVSEVREGLAYFVELADYENLRRLAKTAKHAVVTGGGLIGVEVAECLLHHKVPFTFIIRDPYYWPAALGGPEGEMISAHIRSHGVDLREKQEIAEVLVDGAGKVRGLLTKAGEEIACQLIVSAIGVEPQVDWLRSVKTPPELGRGIRVGLNFQTSLPDVYAAGDCAEFVGLRDKGVIEQIWYSAKRHGELAAYSMLGDPIEYRPPIFYNSAKFFDVEYTTVGAVNDAPAGTENFYHRFTGRDASVRILSLNDAVIGFNLLGSRWNHTVLERWIGERRTMDYCLQHLGEAQFDVEFGRLPLGEMLQMAGSR